ncbi:butyrophilin subfamily 3 member A3-like [Pristis pectinata]|uniref:butyrophilin subfamily 3 member A3-like n=1 Tax=Pristis pectinata TaxID=685728 RepID=UPI00223E6067|nr:butyrophilin subfamily 3 member A3-like [Pristis pectinata]
MVQVGPELLIVVAFQLLPVLPPLVLPVRQDRPRDCDGGVWYIVCEYDQVRLWLSHFGHQSPEVCEEDFARKPGLSDFAVSELGAQINPCCSAQFYSFSEHNGQVISGGIKESTSWAHVQDKLDTVIVSFTGLYSTDELFPAVPDWVLPLVLTTCLLIAANSAVIYWNVKQNRCIKELELRKSIVELGQWRPCIQSDWEREHVFEVSVTLDVETAHPLLKVSEDRKGVRRTETPRDLPNTGKRFAARACALGSEGFTSGRHYWEVEVAGNRGWGLGVAAGSVERKRRVELRPENGFWTIERRWGGGRIYVNTSPRSHIPADPVHRRVGVCLSYEYGTVSFYSADTKSHLHTFTGNKFTEKLYPFFWTWDENQWLRICSGSVNGSGPGTGVRSRVRVCGAETPWMAGWR